MKALRHLPALAGAGWRGTSLTRAVVAAAGLAGGAARAAEPLLQVEPPVAGADAGVPGASLAPAGRKRLDPENIAEKVEGSYFTGLPLVNYDIDTGAGFGARLYHYSNGHRDDPLFASTPYLRRIYAQVFLTTGGYQFHALDLDVPRLWRSLYRIRAALVFERNNFANYFGRGASTLGPLTFPASSIAYTRIEQYRTALAAVQPDGFTYARYDRYVLTRPALRASIEHPVLGGGLRVLAGFVASRVALRDYTGAPVPASGPGGAPATAPEARTHLREDCQAGRVVGCSGGWNNQLKLGMAYDSRDYEPDPTSGVMVDLTSEISSRTLGSVDDYRRITLSPRLFFSPWRGPRQLVIAARALFSVQTGHIPFYDMNGLALTDGDVSGLGGLRTLRGYNQDRFVGAVAGVASLELRWSFYRFTIGTERFQLMLIPFVDFGRVFDRMGDASLRDWKRGQGGALRLAWNQATIVSADVGFSSETSAVYVDFGHQF